MKNTKVVLLLIVFLSLIGADANAQGKKKRRKQKAQTDSLQVYRDFFSTCNIYKQLPLQLEVDVINNSDFVESPVDTVQIKGVFFLDRTASYIRFGGTEQISNDSQLLYVSDEARRMALLPNNGTPGDRLQLFSQLQSGDSSISAYAEKFSAVMKKGSEQNDTILLKSRKNLRYADLPQDEIELIVDPSSGAPVLVSVIKRSLIALDNEEYKDLAGKADMGTRLFRGSAGKYFLLKKQQCMYVFKRLGHEQGRAMPVTIAQRIVRTAHGEFTPVPQFRNYVLVQN